MKGLYCHLSADDYYKRRDARRNARSKPRLPPRKTCDCKVPRTRPQIVCPCSQLSDNEDSEEEEEEIGPLTHESMIELSTTFANAALSYLLQQGHEYELVLCDYYDGGTVGGGARFHHNFNAKRANDPQAPVETFFSQVFMPKHPDGFLDGVIVECCVSLGNSNSLPEKRDYIACAFCSKYVHHPIGECKGMHGIIKKVYPNSEGRCVRRSLNSLRIG